jgi:VWFA-related protein
MRLSQNLPAVLFLNLCLTSTLCVVAQVPARPTENDVVRINAELIQTELTVVDSKGRFVDGLSGNQFELRVDGKLVPVSFFERVSPVNPEARQPARSKPVNNFNERARTIVFFVDDLHLSALSIEPVRKGLLRFIENDMRPEDQVAIVSASGQIGFLQQLTDQRGVLKAAVARIKPQPVTVQDSESVAMSEYIALRIAEGDRATLNFYVNEQLRSLQFTYSLPKYGGKGGGFLVGSEPEQAERMVLRRADSIITQSIPRSLAGLSSIETFLRHASRTQGRKTVFFISDGFILHQRNGELARKLKDVSESAVLANAVIHALDANAFTGRSQSTFMKVDSLGRSDSAASGESTALRAAMTALAKDTGGRTLFDENAFESSVNQALETSNNYYLLAWQPETEAQKINRFKNLDVTVVGRPDLTVRLARSQKFVVRKDSERIPSNLSTTGSVSAEGANVSIAQPLPTSVSLSFLNSPNNGNVLTVSTQITLDAERGNENGKRAMVDLGGVVLNDQGKVIDSFKTQVGVDPLSASPQSDNTNVIYNYRVPLASGIYQVRVAAREQGSSRVGNAAEWIEISDPAAGNLGLSSLLLNSSLIENSTGSDQAPQVQPTVVRRFPKGSRLSFLVFIYNASRESAQKRDSLVADIRVTQFGRTVLTIAGLNIPIEQGTDLQRIPFGGTFPLSSLTAGKYFLEVTVSDRSKKASAKQYIDFELE